MRAKMAAGGDTTPSFTTDELLRHYASIEAQGESVLLDRQQIVELDAQRNRNREALRQLHKLSKSPRGLGDKSWICLGSTFIKMRTKQCTDMLEKDQNVLDDAIDGLHRGLKDKVSTLNEMEGKARLKGFDLKGVQPEDVSTITQTFT